MSDKPTSPTFAPASFCMESAAKGIRKQDVVDAMRGLFLNKKIHVENYGRPRLLPDHATEFWIGGWKLFPVIVVVALGEPGTPVTC